jgi:hypothetical protein
MSKRDIIEHLRDQIIDVDFGDRLMAADELERLRDAVRAERAAILELIEVASHCRRDQSSGVAMPEGTLHMMPSGRWAVCRPGRAPLEITSGELFRVEVAGAKELQLTRMEYDLIDRQHYSVDSYPLRDGLRAAIGE